MPGTECCAAPMITHLWPSWHICAGCGLPVTVTGAVLHDAAVLRAAAAVIERRSSRSSFTRDVLIRVLRRAAGKVT